MDNEVYYHQVWLFLNIKYEISIIAVMDIKEQVLYETNEIIVSSEYKKNNIGWRINTI